MACHRSWLTLATIGEFGETPKSVLINVTISDILYFMTITQLFDAIGRQNISTTFNVSGSAVRMCVTRDTIPATWKDEIKRLASKAGVEAPDGLFTSHKPVSKQGKAA